MSRTLINDLPEHSFGVLLELGNAAMREPHHVSAALRTIAGRMDDGEFTGQVRDANGNTVGEFHVQFWPTGEDDES